LLNCSTWRFARENTANYVEQPLFSFLTPISGFKAKNREWPLHPRLLKDHLDTSVAFDAVSCYLAVSTAVRGAAYQDLHEDDAMNGSQQSGKTSRPGYASTTSQICVAQSSSVSAHYTDAGVIDLAVQPDRKSNQLSRGYAIEDPLQHPSRLVGSHEGMLVLLQSE